MGLFLISPERIEANRAVLDEGESRHLLKVLRKRPGDVIELSDGRGHYFEGRIVQGRDTAQVEILKAVDSPTSPPPHLILCQALLKNPRMDWLVEKAAELQVQALFPFSSERSVVKVPPGRDGDRKIARWQKIAAAALKQSRQSLLPQIGPMFTWSGLLHRFEKTLAWKLLLLAERPDLPSLKTLRKSALPPQEFPLWIVLVGPEGGLTTKEISAAERSGFTACSLGPVTLRAETAALSAVSVLNYLKL